MKRVAGTFVAVGLAFASQAATPTEAEAQCANCKRECGSQHTAPLGGVAYESIHEMCLPSIWCDGHPLCGVGILEIDEFRHDHLENLIDQANDGDFVAVLAMLRTFHGQAYINKERSALQVRTLATCRDAADTLIAHIPLDATQLAIATEWQRSEGEGFAVDEQD